MAILHLLGTGAAVSDPHRTTTMLSVTTGADTVVVDCGGDVVQRLLAAEIELDSITALIVTHEHPDHVSGFPLFMEKIWLAGRTRPIPVYGIRPAIDQARRALEAFDTSSWNLPEILWREVDHVEGARILESDTWKITASPGQHGVPVVGLRIASLESGGVVAYSCDTEPSASIQELARGADILVHEATGEGRGHSSAEQAAQIAARASAERLILVHLSANLTDDRLSAARAIFEATVVGEELGAYEF